MTLVSDDGVETDTLVNIEEISATEFDDDITLSNVDNVAIGENGNDVISGRRRACSKMRALIGPIRVSLPASRDDVIAVLADRDVVDVAQVMSSSNSVAEISSILTRVSVSTPSSDTSVMKPTGLENINGDAERRRLDLVAVSAPRHRHRCSRCLCRRRAFRRARCRSR